jgi:hypothetical protein
VIEKSVEIKKGGKMKREKESLEVRKRRREKQ